MSACVAKTAIGPGGPHDGGWDGMEWDGGAVAAMAAMVIGDGGRKYLDGIGDRVRLWGREKVGEVGR